MSFAVNTPFSELVDTTAGLRNLFQIMGRCVMGVNELFTHWAGEMSPTITREFERVMTRVTSMSVELVHQMLITLNTLDTTRQPV